jgi:5-methylcytosine-specific restriction endonuclease McrA
MKTCRICQVEKPIESFAKTTGNGRRHVCRSCQVKQRKPETVRENGLRAYYKKASTSRAELNARAVEYRKIRKESGNPIIRKTTMKDENRLNRWQMNKLKRVVFELKGMLCDYCGAIATEIDHVQPLSRGGTHDLNNLVPSCKSCNSSKKDKTVEEWHQTKHLRLVK